MISKEYVVLNKEDVSPLILKEINSEEASLGIIQTYFSQPSMEKSLNVRVMSIYQRMEDFLFAGM